MGDWQQLEDNALAQARQGSAAGFEFLYHRHQRRVYLLCLRMTGNRADAEELTQETFLLLFRKIATFRGASAFSTWLHRLTVNVVLTRLRRKRLLETSLEDSPEGAEISGGRGWAATESAANTLDRIRVQRALDRLEPRGRKVVLLHDLAGYGHSEIAAATGHSESSSKVSLYRAHVKLRALLRPPGAERLQRRAAAPAAGQRPARAAPDPRQTVCAAG
jgi:RNA polymerase sigma-70 factor (ECF subfamily)